MAVSSQAAIIPTLPSPLTSSSTYPSPVGGASLLLAFKPTRRQTVLVIGAGLLAATRAFAALEAGFHVVVAYEESVQTGPCAELLWRVQRGELDLVVVPRGGFEELFESQRQKEGGLGLVCVTDTLVPYSGSAQAAGVRSFESAREIVDVCRRWGLPVNVADVPGLCDFTFPATHRFASPSPSSSASTSTSEHTPDTHATSLQFAITTNGRACRLASRLKRQVVLALPKDVGSAVDNVGEMRRMLHLHSNNSSSRSAAVEGGWEDEEDASAVTPPVNAPVPQLDGSATEDNGEKRRRRMRWVAQMSEYWPLERLAGLTKVEMEEALDKFGGVQAAGANGEGGGEVAVPSKKTCPKRRTEQVVGVDRVHTNLNLNLSSHSNSEPLFTADEAVHPPIAVGTALALPTSHHRIPLAPPSPPTPKGRILLIGSGPGHPSLLTVAARRALTELGTLILSDKLVPSQVLDLIPKHAGVKLYIAKKYPGNADGAQNELMDMAVEGARRGEVVVRLKQGDPFLYGRGGEEVLFFRSQGFEPLVIPGVSSALAGPLLAGIPVTQRGVAESLTVCTGVGRKGRDVDLPGYERGRTLVVLMGVARLSTLVAALTEENATNGRRRGAAYPSYTPIAIIERASCPDQRTLVSTLNDIEEALGRIGDQRPPGMIVVGWAAVALTGSGDLDVLDDANDSGSGGNRGGEAEGKAVDGDDCGAAGSSLSAKDQTRVMRWLGGERWRVFDGLPNADTWNLFES